MSGDTYVRSVWLMATAIGRNTMIGSQAAKVGRNILSPPSDWQASVASVKATATDRQMPIQRKTHPRH